MLDAITGLYHVVFYQPIYNAIIWLYTVLPGNDLGVAVVAVTVIIRLVLYPLSLKSIRAQKMMTELQPKLEEIKKKYANDKEKQAQETMRLYREEKVNPLSSCLPILLQLPFLIAIFHALQGIANPEGLKEIYAFLPHPETIQTVGFFGLLDLAKASPIVAILAGLAQFAQGRMLVQRRPPTHNSATKDEDFSVMVNQQMTYIMPLVTTVIAWSFPSGVSLYWFLSTGLLALQQWFTFSRDQQQPNDHESHPGATPASAR